MDGPVSGDFSGPRTCGIPALEFAVRGIKYGFDFYK
jgi:hypothetical protein